MLERAARWRDAGRSPERLVSYGHLQGACPAHSRWSTSLPCEFQDLVPGFKDKIPDGRLEKAAELSPHSRAKAQDVDRAGRR